METERALKKIFDVIIDEVRFNEEFRNRMEQVLKKEPTKVNSQYVKINKINTIEVDNQVEIEHENKEQIEKVYMDNGNVSQEHIEKENEVQVYNQEQIKIDKNNEVQVDNKEQLRTYKEDKLQINKEQKPKCKRRKRQPALFNPNIVLLDGEEELRNRLEKLDQGQLRDIIAQYSMDPSKITSRWRKSDRLIEHIIEMSVGRLLK